MGVIGLSQTEECPLKIARVGLLQSMEARPLLLLQFWGVGRGTARYISSCPFLAFGGGLQFPEPLKPGTNALKAYFSNGTLERGHHCARLPNALSDLGRRTSVPQLSGMAGWRGGRERSMARREVPYPGEWQLPTSGRSSGEAFPVVVAAAAAVVPGVFVPLVSWPWPAGGLGASRCAPASPVSLGWRGCGGLIGEDVPVAEKRRTPLQTASFVSLATASALGAGGRRRNLAPWSSHGGPSVARPGRLSAGGCGGRGRGSGPRRRERLAGRLARAGWTAPFPPAGPRERRAAFRGAGPHRLPATRTSIFSGPCVECFGGCF